LSEVYAYDLKEDISDWFLNNYPVFYYIVAEIQNKRFLVKE